MERAIAEGVRLVTRTAGETRDLGRALAAVAGPGDRIGLIGPLGAGKTEFAKGFAAGLGVAEVVLSPTFTLMAEYAGRLALFHLDVYRIGGPVDVLASGLLDERQRAGVTLVEWAERLPASIRPDELRVEIGPGEEDAARVVRLAGGVTYGAYLEAAARWASQHGRTGGSGAPS
jgi:tRNA threonylcarbamoyladenosine biosynthesis protein TsaE